MGGAARAFTGIVFDDVAHGLLLKALPAGGRATPQSIPAIAHIEAGNFATTSRAGTDPLRRSGSATHPRAESLELMVIEN